ncbi:hypothetical protein FKM82_024631, partial [Ascaphus truei]
RLLLLLQSFTGYTEVIGSEGGLPPARGMGPCMSIGLAVRKYWSSMLKLGTLYQQAKSSARGNVSVSADSETARDVSSCLSSSRLQSAPSRSQRSTLTPTPRESKPCIARDIRTVGSQTLESALVPCDACATVQASLREVSDAIIQVCSGQNLPCSLSKIREMLPSRGILSPTEMRYWASEESKDLTRIGKHLSELTQVIGPLRSQLEGARVENETLQGNIESCKVQLQAEKEEQQRQGRESERRLQEKGQQSQEMVNKLERDKDELRKGAAVLEERVSILKEE